MAKTNVGKVVLFGTIAEMAGDVKVLANFLRLTQGFLPEGEARRILSGLIQEGTLRSEIMYGGNGVWNKKKILQNLNAIVRANDMSRMSDYLYNFLSLCCGSIAHYNKCGWIETYPTVDALRKFFRRNEFGQSVLDHQPIWATDRIEIIKEAEQIL